MSGFISPIEALQDGVAARAVVEPRAPAASNFGQWMTGELQALNRQLVTAERGVQSLAAGASANLHDVMIQLEQARLALQLASQVRARVVEAYQEVMRMQV